MTDERATVEAFAEAAARLADPFADRAALLESMGLDDAGWRQLDTSWRDGITRRTQAGDRSLAEQFAAAFERERRRLAELRKRPERTHAFPPRAQIDVDQTAVAHVALEPALPFRGARSSPNVSAATADSAAANSSATAQSATAQSATAQSTAAQSTAANPAAAGGEVDETAVMLDGDALGLTLPFDEDA